MVDVVEGDRDYLYRRHSAEWLRVIPLDGEVDEIDYNEKNFDACMA